jgi:hypothetical protein
MSKSTQVPPTIFKGTLTEWMELEPKKQYAISNRERIAAVNKTWRQKNYTKNETIKKLWRQNNSERVKAFKKRWKQQNATKVAASQHKRYIKKEREFYEMFGPLGVI